MLQLRRNGGVEERKGVKNGAVDRGITVLPVNPFKTFITILLFSIQLGYFLTTHLLIS